MKFTIHTQDGKVLRSGECPDGHEADQVNEGEMLLLQASRPNMDQVVGGVVLPLPEKPSVQHRFNYTTKQWEDPRTLQDLKDARREYINTERLKANQSHFTHEGKQIAADALSRGDIDAINGEINNTGNFPTGWPGAWKCLDNSWLPITTVTEWRALYTSMVNQGTANFGHAQALKAQIAASTTIAEVEAIIW